MATLIAMPRLGMIMTEGTLARWLKSHGEQVRRGEPIAEIETDKITYEIEAPDAGLLHQVVPEGVVVAVEGPLAYILAPGEAPPPSAPAAATPAATRTAVPAQSPSGPAPAGQVRASPVARRLAREHGIDLATIHGSGPGGRIVEADILRLVEEQATAAPAVQAPHAEPKVARRIPLTGVRRLIAQRMAESLRTTAQLTLSLEADAGLLAQVPAVPPARDAALVRVLALALREFPVLNSTVRDDAILVLEDINIGVAVSADDLLTVPVVRQADRKPLAEISRELRDLLRKARRNALTLDDLSGGTFTLSNLGPQGIDVFTPILNPPQAGILGVGRVAERPVVRDGQLTVRPTVWLSLTFDHRVTDGAPAARFLQRVADLLHDPHAVGVGEG
ncbi:MAG: 2-oxo acid dehydrogenase subunit E2 [Chloroflexi bacterium]|nr:2-oxo acid dehydrogenase subunit E2 [Chloroflexota bacterium]